MRRRKVARPACRQPTRHRVGRHVPTHHQVGEQPPTLASRRLIVRAARLDSPSSSRTTPGPRRGLRWSLMKASTSAVVTSTGSLATTPKNTFKSQAAASSVFGLARAATSSR
jgi:hypothetical protein